MNTKAIQRIRLTLLRSKTWRYLRYLHFREAFAKVADEIETVCVCGTGHGYAELAVAAEYPRITFTLTDIMNPKHGYPNYHRTMDMAWKWGVDNLHFSIWNVLQPTERRFDIVCSTEILEHIEQDAQAAENMRAAATKYVYCLVPFADDATNADPEKRRRAWEKHEHYVYGYSAQALSKLFPDPVYIAGTYWQDHGQMFRQRLTLMGDEAIAKEQANLEREAEDDLIDKIPEIVPEALGIKILSRTSN